MTSVTQVRVVKRSPDVFEVVKAEEKLFPFMQLPAEIRVMIYRQIFMPSDQSDEAHPTILIDRSNDIRFQNWLPSTPNFCNSQLNILLASKQLYAEAHPILWSQTTFRFATILDLNIMVKPLPHLKPDHFTHAHELQNVQLMAERGPIRRIIQKRNRGLRRLARGASVRHFEMVHGSQCACFCDSCSEMTEVFHKALEAAKASKANEQAQLRDEQAKWQAMMRLANLRAQEIVAENEEMIKQFPSFFDDAEEEKDDAIKNNEKLSVFGDDDQDAA